MKSVGPGSAAADAARIWELLADVSDPEIPVLSIVDLGIVRYVRREADGRWHVGLTQTYSGCPATEVIRATVRAALAPVGPHAVSVDEVLSPAWTSDWLTAEGRAKLKAFGIAPPPDAVTHPRELWPAPPVACPRCDSDNTERVSEFGSTPCKAHYRCCACGEPFDHFKCL